MESMIRNEVLTQIKRSLKARSATRYSVTGGSGTAYGWLRIRTMGTTWMSDAERQALAQLLGLEHVHQQGWKVADSPAHYREALDRAAGRPMRAIAQPYWD